MPLTKVPCKICKKLVALNRKTGCCYVCDTRVHIYKATK